jgi:hypothetical protein
MQTSQQLEHNIQQLESVLAPVTKELDMLIREFAAALPPAVEAWMNAEVKRKVDENASKVNAGGVEPLRPIKADLAVLVAQLPTICQAAIGKPEDWPHRRGLGVTPQRESSSRESFFAAVFRSAINNVGALLNKYGLLTDPPGYVRSWERAGTDQFRYAFNPGFDERNFASVQQYNLLRTSHKRQVEELEAKRLDLAKARARELWDEA